MQNFITNLLLRIVHLDYLGGNCPVQGEGKIDGYDIYFRSRGDNWTFDIGESPILGQNSIFSVRGNFGDWPRAGWMPWFRAYRIIYKCIKLYKYSKYRSDESIKNAVNFWDKIAKRKKEKGLNHGHV